MNLEVIFGPPGTGKTTELARLVQKYAAQEGSESLLLSAYTRTAAEALAGHDLPLEPHQLGTLHALCFHGLGRPSIAETHYQDWNDTYPVYTLSPQKSLVSDDMRDPYTPELYGDLCLDRLNLLRHQGIPEDRWPDSIHGFATRWTAWKREHEYLDFTDLIAYASVVLPVAPGRPATLILDEAQDLSVLQWDLIKQWGLHTTRVIAAGDDDQALYRWAGANFEPLLTATTRRVLPHSYRIPRRIHAWAERFTTAIKHRQPKTWDARDEPGILVQEPGDWHNPEGIVARLRSGLADVSGTMACIAPCSYMLEPLLRLLAQEGIPFANKWRRNRQDWNPLASQRHHVGIGRRVLDFLRPMDRLWSWQELATWLPLLRTEGVLHARAKHDVSMRASDPHLCTRADIEAVFLPHTVEGALQSTATWLEDHVLQSKARFLHYPLRVYKHYGRAGLADEPRLTVGTAHSLKGAEADTVVLWPALSRAQQLACYEGGDASDDVYRMLYVGSTRAREALYVIGETM